MNALMNILIRLRAAGAQNEVNKLRGKIRELETSLRSARGASDGMFGGASLQSINVWGSRVQWAGRQLVANFTVPLGAAGFAVTRWSLENEAAMVRVRKVYGDASMTNEKFAATMEGPLTRAFELLSAKYAVAQKEVREIAGEWAAAGATGASLAKGVETTLKTMTLGEMDAAAATEALIAIQAQYGTDSEGLIAIIEKLNATENATGITFKGLVEGMSRSASTARDAGVDIDHLAAMLAALTPASGSAAQSGNALKTMISRLLSPTKDAKEVLGLMGLQMDDVGWKTLDAAQRLELLATRYHELEGSGDGFVSSQAAVVSSVVASRYQINRFSTLMRDVYSKMDGDAKTNGYYGKTLTLLADDAAVARTAMNELQTVLKSDPTVMKRAGVVIQNSLMKAYQVILPHVIMLAQGVAKLAEKFANLDPRLQKAIFLFAAFLAVLGPPLSLIGASAVAFSQIASMMTKVFAPLKILGILFGGAGAGAKLAAGEVARSSVTIAGSVSGGAQAATVAAAQHGVAGTAVGRAWTAAAATVAAATAAQGATLVAGASAASGRVVAVAAATGPKVIAALTGPWGIAIAAVIGLLVVFKDQIKQVFGNIKSMMRGGAVKGEDVVDLKGATGDFENTKKAFAGLVGFFQKGIGYIHKAFASLPAGVRNALQAVLNMVKTVALKIYELFSYINPWAHHSPSLVENVTTGMDRVGKIFGLAVGTIRKHMRSGYSELSRFGKATADFMKKYENMQQRDDEKVIRDNAGAGAVKSYRALAATLKPLRKDLDGVGAAVDKQKIKVDGLARSLDKAQKSADAARATLGELEGNASSLTDQIQAANDEIGRYANSGITGMKAVNDQIFENEMAQKRLRLEMLKMNDVDVEKLKSKLASLQGDIDNLRGEQADLRSSGAGSEILGTYDQMIAELEGQQGVINKSVQPYNELQKKLEELERQGQIIDLEKSIKFDPLTKQIEELAGSYEELPFDKIVNGIKDQQSQIDTLQPKLDQANEAIERQQKVVTDAEKAVDSATSKYENAQAVLTTLQATYQGLEDEIRSIEQAMNDVVSAASGMQQAIDAAKKSGGGKDGLSPGAENFLDAAGGSYRDPGDHNLIGDEGGSLNEYIDGLVGDVGSLMGNLDLLGPIKKAWEKVKSWWSGTVVPVWSELVGGFGKIFSGVDFSAPFDKVANWFKTNPIGIAISGFASSIGGTFSTAWKGIVDAFKTIVPPIRDAVIPLLESLGGLFSKVIWPIVKKVAAQIGKILVPILGALVTAFTVVANIISKVAGPVLKWIGGEIASVMKVATNLINFITNVFTGNWSAAFGNIRTAFTLAWDIIVHRLKSFGSIIWNAVVGAFTGIGDSVKAIWDGIGSFLVDGLFNGVLQKAAGIKDWILTYLVDPLKKAFTNPLGVAGETSSTFLSYGKSLIGGLWDGIKNRWNAVAAWFKNLGATVKSLLSDLGSAIASRGKELLSGLWNGIADRWASIKNWFSGLGSSIKELLFNLGVAIASRGKELLSGLWNGIADRWASIKEWFSGLGSNIRGLISNAATAISSRGREFISGLSDGITDRWTSVKNWFGSLDDKIKDSIISPTKVLWDIGSKIMSGLWDGLKAKWEDVKDWLGGIGSKIKDLKGPERVDKVLLVNEGKWIMGGFGKGLAAGFIPVERFVGGIADTILNDVDAAARAIDSSMTGTAGMLARATANGGAARIESSATYTGGGEVTYNFYGNLEFPNITDPDDAKDFLSNLESIAGGATR